MKKDLKYHCDVKNTPSHPERLIGELLTEFKIQFKREVVFELCINPKTGKNLRFDFYFPDKNLVIEYDGKGFHDSEKVKYRDRVKDRFAKSKGIRMVRIVGLRMMREVLSQEFGIANKKKRKEINKKVEAQHVHKAISIPCGDKKVKNKLIGIFDEEIIRMTTIRSESYSGYLIEMGKLKNENRCAFLVISAAIERDIKSRRAKAKK